MLIFGLAGMSLQTGKSRENNQSNYQLCTEGSTYKVQESYHILRYWLQALSETTTSC